MSSYYIGIDGGGTKTHAVLLNEDLELIDEVYSKAANIRTDTDLAYTSICDVIDTLCQRHNLESRQLKIGIGVAGYSIIDKRQMLQGKLAIKYPNIVLNSDCHIACLAAHQSNDGGIIICGTGVVGYSIYKGQYMQMGGWGFPHGDLGGAAWLGLEAAKYLCKAIDGITPWSITLKEIYARFFAKDSQRCKMWLVDARPSDYAQLAKEVFATADDLVMLKILKQAISEITQFILAFKKISPDLPLKLAGGLAALYITKLQEVFPELILSEMHPAMGAGYMAAV